LRNIGPALRLSGERHRNQSTTGDGGTEKALSDGRHRLKSHSEDLRTGRIRALWGF
jgi:hypothetical protein